MKQGCNTIAPPIANSNKRATKNGRVCLASETRPQGIKYSKTLPLYFTIAAALAFCKKEKNMIRPDDARKVKIRLPEYLQPAKKRVAGKITYICPFCGNGSGRDGDGMCIDPNGDGTQAKCFKCGFYGDILDIYMKQHNCDVVTAFKALCNHFKIEISGDVARASTGQQNEERLITMRTTTEDPLNSQIEDTDGNID